MTAVAPAPAIESPAAAELSAFLDTALPAFRAVWGGEDRSFESRRDWQRRLNEGGWVAPGWSTENGGRGLGVTDRVACDLELGRRRAPVVAGILGVNNVGPTIAAWGTPEQKSHLAAILSTDEIWCQGFSEPEAGSDLASLRTRAVRDGDHFIVNGQKVWTSQGMEATHCQLLVRTDADAPKHKGISALAIPLDLPGIERRPLRQLTGETDFAEVFFTDVRVPVSCLLGPENKGWGVTMTTLAHERTGVIGLVSAMERDTLELVGANQRSRGTRLPAHLRDDVTARYVESRVLGIMGEQSLRDAEAGGAPGPEQSIIKLSWSQLSQKLAETRVAVEGLSGIIGEDTAAATTYLISRSSTIAGGTTEVMKNILAERVLGLPQG